MSEGADGPGEHEYTTELEHSTQYVSTCDARCREACIDKDEDESRCKGQD